MRGNLHLFSSPLVSAFVGKSSTIELHREFYLQLIIVEESVKGPIAMHKHGNVVQCMCISTAGMDEYHL